MIHRLSHLFRDTLNGKLKRKGRKKKAKNKLIWNKFIAFVKIVWPNAQYIASAENNVEVILNSS